MSSIILGEKKDQSRVFTNKGEWIPVTFINTNSCYLVEIKEPEKHGFFSLKVGMGKAKNIKKPAQGELAKAGIKTPLRFLREFRIKQSEDKVNIINEDNKKGVSIGEAKIFVGEMLSSALLFKKGDYVNVSGTSKGKGFQGVVKRHGFAGGPKTHGQSDRLRAPGSIGQTTTPGRVLKGKRMAGRMGGERITVKKLEVIEAREDGLLVKGLVPGALGGLLEVRS